MKKLSLYLMAFTFLLLVVPNQLNAAILDTNPVATDSIAAVDAATANALLVRLNEIAIIDKEALRQTERKALRKEVRSIKKQLKAINNGGVYISVGSLLLVIILLILLL